MLVWLFILSSLHQFWPTVWSNNNHASTLGTSYLGSHWWSDEHCTTGWASSQTKIYISPASAIQSLISVIVLLTENLGGFFVLFWAECVPVDITVSILYWHKLAETCFVFVLFSSITNHLKNIYIFHSQCPDTQINSKNTVPSFILFLIKFRHVFLKYLNNIFNLLFDRYSHLQWHWQVVSFRMLFTQCS